MCVYRKKTVVICHLSTNNDALGSLTHTHIHTNTFSKDDNDGSVASYVAPFGQNEWHVKNTLNNFHIANHLQ